MSGCMDRKSVTPPFLFNHDWIITGKPEGSSPPLRIPLTKHPSGICQGPELFWLNEISAANNNIWVTLYFMLDFIFSLTTKISPVYPSPQLSMYDTPLRDQDIEQLYFYKHKWGYRLKVIQGFMYF